MPRIARAVAVDLPHHITQRGNNRQTIFKDDKDKIKYLALLQEYSYKYKLTILCYCLMPNHVHLIVIPEKEDSMAKTFNLVQMKYAHYFNEKVKQCGHLWQGRYYSCILDEKHLIVAARYVERNPVRAKLVRKPWECKWSSALSNIGEAVPVFNTNKLFEYMDMNPSTWKKYISDDENLDFIKNIRKYTMSGRPLASRNFIQGLEKKLERNLRLLPKGRPGKGK